MEFAVANLHIQKKDSYCIRFEESHCTAQVDDIPPSRKFEFQLDSLTWSFVNIRLLLSLSIPARVAYKNSDQEKRFRYFPRW